MIKNTRAKPDFFILGAPKCGTTSMDEWLRSHPSIYLAQKEPHYFNTDHQNRLVSTLSDYEALFATATDKYLAIGETSVRYLYSHEAVANILNYNAQAKFIVMLRNPIDMVYSWHDQIYFSGMEDNKDFATAWLLQTQRLKGTCIPATCSEVKMLFYGPVCRLGEQLQRLYKQVSADRVHCIFFDDLTQSPRHVYQQVLNFLAVEDDNKEDFPIYNRAKTYRLHTLRYILPWLGNIKTRLGISQHFGILEFIRRKNLKIRKRKPMTMQMHQTLIKYFQDDIHLLAQLSRRDLNHWMD